MKLARDELEQTREQLNNTTDDSQKLVQEYHALQARFSELEQRDATNTAVNHPDVFCMLISSPSLGAFFQELETLRKRCIDIEALEQAHRHDQDTLRRFQQERIEMQAETSAIRVSCVFLSFSLSLSLSHALSPFC